MAESKRLVDFQWELLKAELTHIGGTIRQHDEITKSVKNWAVVTWTASIGLSLKDPHLHRFVWITAIVPLVFWIVDGSYRRIQRSFIRRITDISNYVNSSAFRVEAAEGSPLEFPLLIMRNKDKVLKDTLLGTMLFRSVSVLYLGLALCSLMVWLVVK
jgi:hypothetical protein